MDNSFFVYLQQLEQTAFFSGYPLLYTIAVFFSGPQKSKNNLLNSTAAPLPHAYALVGTLYLGLQLKNLYTAYTIKNAPGPIQWTYVTLWALLAVLFWMPALARKPLLSLLHSLVFFFLFAKTIFSHSISNEMLKNELKIYTVSLLLNLAAIVAVAAIYIVLKKRKKSATKQR